jgi:colanic acid/amylovoran biosynthesis glycosyltransferase
VPTVAYLANIFPSPVEPYVVEEIRELRRRGMTVLPCSALTFRDALDDGLKLFAMETLYLQPLQMRLLVRAIWFCLRSFPTLKDFFHRALLTGNERPMRRLSAVLHTWLGVYFSLLLKGRNVEHIHVHHGYFSSWVAMVAARLLGISFSMTLHGSDLLVHAAFLDTKLKNCKFCVTVSEFNRRHILKQYEVEPSKVIVQRMGVHVQENDPAWPTTNSERQDLLMLAVGRLHPVKDHAFLIRSCHELKKRGLRFSCQIAGEGLERASLEKLIRELGLEAEIKLLGHVPRHQLEAYYRNADLVVLTSRSEGVPLVLMEAMALARPVLAPAITGIPELVLHGKTGFLYRPGVVLDFVSKVELVSSSQSALSPLLRAARQHVVDHFNGERNLARLSELFISRIGQPAHDSYENPVLQQI